MILSVVVFIAVMVGQRILKDKEQHAKRMQKMAAEREQAEREAVFERHKAEMSERMRHCNSRAEWADADQRQHNEVEIVPKRIPVPDPIPVPSPIKNRHNKNSNRSAASTATRTTTKTPVMQPEQVVKSESLDFDIERAVIESEILKPKYTEY